METSTLQEKKKPMVTVTTAWLAMMKDSYDTHFSRYCLHKKNPVHKIPAPVWKLVYDDFEKEYRDECTVLDIQYDNKYPTERNLQDNLRDYLSTLVTGTSDTPEGNVTPQNDENLNRIKQTDGHARRNMINLRERLINEADSVGDGVEEITSVQAKGERRTNIQKRAADSLDRMNSIIGESSGKSPLSFRRKLIWQKRNSGCMLRRIQPKEDTLH
jgi:hypothetical protein